MRALVATALTKTYPGASAPAVRGVDLHVEQGEIVAVVGPSGCGKTTLLRMIAGLETPDEGRIEIGGVCVAGEGRGVPTEKRGIGLVFQEHALFPHMSVARNVAFAPRTRHHTDPASRARELLKLVGLEDLASRAPHQLSGGEQQRVAVARALAGEPTLLLLDEPFNSLDASRRVAMRRELKRLLEATGTSALLVTHDQEEALSLADRIAVIRAGCLEQVGPAEEVYARPHTAFVAEFVAGATVLDVVAERDTAVTPLGPVGLTGGVDGPVRVALRPEQLRVVSEHGVAATVLEREFLGASVSLALDVDGLRVRMRTDASLMPQEGAVLQVAVEGVLQRLNDAPCS